MKIELINVSYLYSTNTDFEKKVLDNINLTIENGRIFLVLGPNGSGKTTLLQILALLLRPTSGKILINGENAWKNPAKYRKDIGIAFQFPENQFFSLSVYDEVTFAPKNFGIENLEEMYIKTMKMFELNPDEFRSRVPFTLSGGEKRKVGTASIVSYDPEIIILDEPFVSLDWEGRFEMLRYIKEWKKMGKGVVVATHHEKLFEDIADDSLIL
ncbi:MAG: ABC transporter ATP-binding protein [Thermotogaceae bacterium]|nr:ABC transporter ATP-binding protein [Thermotogaceae bacterium]